MIRFWFIRHRLSLLLLLPLLLIVSIPATRVIAAARGGAIAGRAFAGPGLQAPGAFTAGNGTIRYGGGLGGPGLQAPGAFRGLPYGSRSYAYGGSPYYWYGGGWYAPAYYGGDLYYYPATVPMPGVVGDVPMPYAMINTPSGVVYVSNGVYYKPFLSGGMIWYRIVGTQ
jgi:hypothetical protein